METIQLAFSTFWLRPYVLVFFLVYIAGSLLVFGWRRALLFFAYAYAVAFVLEICSTRFGFPFGMYVYHPEATLNKELWIKGIPLMSTLSFVFLSFFCYRVSIFFLPGKPYFWPFLTALSMMLVDVAIDPVTLLGEKWFLRDLYHYPEKGFYFGVPFSNFLGWAFTGLTISFPFAVEDLFKKRELEHQDHLWRFDFLIGYSYVGVYLFMAAVAFWVGVDALGVIAVTLGLCYGLGISLRKKFFLHLERREISAELKKEVQKEPS